MTTPLPLPGLTSGALVRVRPGVRWASRDIGGETHEVVGVHRYPSVGMVVLQTRPVGTTSRPEWSCHLGPDDVEEIPENRSV